MTASRAATVAVTLDDEERELLGLELRTLLPALSGPRRERYAALARAVGSDAAVPAELLPALESVLELALQTGRARQLYRAEGERILTSVLRRTPRGRELAAHLDQVNQALRVVAGHTLDAVSVRMRTLGHYTVTIQSEAATLTLAIRPDGVGVESVAAGDVQGPAG
ncbi:MAG: hypothetical protein ACRDZ4_21880 [Egibacteraceae bacterium]